MNCYNFLTSYLRSCKMHITTHNTISPLRLRLHGVLSARNMRLRSQQKLVLSTKILLSVWSCHGTRSQVPLGEMQRGTIFHFTISHWTLWLWGLYHVQNCFRNNHLLYISMFKMLLSWSRVTESLYSAAIQAGVSQGKAKNIKKEIKLSLALISARRLNIVLKTPKVT